MDAGLSNKKCRVNRIEHPKANPIPRAGQKVRDRSLPDCCSRRIYVNVDNGQKCSASSAIFATGHILKMATWTLHSKAHLVALSHIDLALVMLIGFVVLLC